MVTLSDYEAFKRKEKAAGAGAAGIVLGQEFAGTPDEAAGDLNLAAEHAKATGAPVAPSAMVKEYRGLFQRNLDTLKAGTILSSSPTLSAWLREPDNAAVSRDDLENLSWFEQQGRGLVNAVDRGVKQIQLGMDQSAANSLAQRAADRGRSFDEILQDESKKSVAGLSLIFAGWRQSTAMLDAAFGNDTEGKAAFMQQRAAEMQAKIAEIPKSPNAKAIDDWMTAMDWSSPDALSTVLQNVALNPIGFAEWVTQTGAEVAPQIAAATAVTAATRNPTAGAAVFGGSSYLVNSGAQSLEFVQEAGYDLATPAGALAAIKDRKLMASAAARGQAYGLVVGAMDTLSGGLAAKELAKSPAANLFLQTLLQSGLAGAGELSGQVVASMPIDPASIFGEMLAEVGSAPAEVAGIGGRAFLDKQARAKASEDRVNMFKAISGQAVASKLRERMPDKFRQFIERATADGPVENVFVPADKFVEYFQSKGLDPAKVLENLPGVTAADLDMALETGGDLKIPTASYAASIAGSNHDAWMVENMRFNPDEFTAAEAKEFNAKIEDAREEAYQLAEQLRRDDDELRSVEREIYDTMTERLRAAGRATDVATTEAMLYPAFYRTMAERSGLSTEEFLARYPLPRIEGAAPAGMQLKDVTALKRTLAEARTRRAAPVEKGMSLLEFIDKNGGVIDTGGDIAAMDAATIKRGKGKKTLRIVRKANPLAGMASMLGVGKADTKGGLDDMARAAYEAGYMANDPRVMAHHQAIQSGGEAVDLIPALLDAIRSEMAGVRDHGGNVTAADATDGIDAIEEYLSGLGVSLDNTDEEIRAAMERGQAPATDGAMYAQGKIDTSSAAFKEWFGNSKIVDESGKPLVVYHGSPSKGIDAFRMDDSNYKTEGTGFWFTNEVKSGTYSGPDGEVYPVYLKMERPIVIEWDGHWASGPAVDYVEYRIVDQQGLPVDGRGYFEERKNAQAQLDRMAAAGRDVSGLEISETPIRGEHTTDERVRRIRRENPTADGVILRNVAGGGDYSAEGFGGLIAGDEFVVFEPTQIKSVNNRGTWSANDPNILNQSAPAERNMFVAHNLSPDGLMNVVKMGGLPMPSLAVARVDRGGFDGFGSITLLGSPDLIDPKGGNGAKTYNADAYSPRYPSIYYDVDEKKFNALNVPLVAAIKEYGGRAYDAIDLSQLEDRGPIRLPVSYGLKLGWLKENGLAPVPVLLPDGTLHWYGGRDAIDAAAAPHEQAIKEWAAEKLSALVKRERIFKGVTPSGNRRYVDHTIENVLADMRARLKEGEGWNYGVGSTRARFAKVFKSITGMQADRDKLVDAEAIKAVKDGFDDRFGEILEALRPYYRFDQSGFGYMDDASAMIGEMATKGTRALDEGFKDIPAHVLDDVKQFTADLASAPTGYFETKINRIVSLSEFTAAIVPSDLAPKYVEALKAAGLNVRAYDSSVAGARNEAIMAVDKDRGGEVLFQPAYHGTPHLFEKFSTDKIGTGEGAQAFGWGLYFASNKAVASWYRSTLANRGGVAINGKSFIDSREAADALGLVGYEERYPVQLAFDNVKRGMPVDQAIADALDNYPHFDQAAVRRGLDAFRASGPVLGGGGRLYSVDVPSDDELLQWDNPLSEQPDGVRSRLPMFDEFMRSAEQTVGGPENAEALKVASRGKFYYAWLSKMLRGDRAASEALLAAGIPGLRYLDGGSRRAGDGSHNYVIFDGSRVSITGFEQPADGSGFGNGAGLGASPRGMIQFPAAGVGNGETIISTFAGADLSTVLHESGHYFLTVFRDMAIKDPTGPMGKDFDAIKDWWHENAAEVARDANAAVQGVTVTADDVRLALDAGTSGDALKDQMINVGMQEQFARGVEAYLMEGKAPSIGLRSAFEKFRAWLISIYRRALGLNVAISDEMRGVFDRLLATDQEIAEAKQQSGATDPIFATAEEMGLSPEDYAKFRRLYEQANDEAAAATLDRIMAPIRRAKTAIYKAERKAVVADVTAALQNEPVYRAIQELRFGKGYDGEDVPAVKLSRQAIEKDYGPGHIGFLPGATKDGKGHRNAVFSDEGGVHPDVAAGMYGFASGEAFLDALEKAPDLKDAIEAEVEKEMAARHSDPMTDGSVQRVALQATHSDKRGQVLAAELKALNDVAGYDRGLTFKEARETARRTLRGLPVRDAVRSDRFLAAERKAGEQAFTLGRAVTREGLWMDAARRKVAKAVSATLRAEDGALALGVNAATDKANENTLRNNQKVADLIEAKRRQLLNHMLYDESRKVADGVDALVKKAGKLNKSDAKLAKARNIDYVRAARAIAAKFGLARPESDFDFGVWIEQLRVDDAITADALTTAIATYTQDAKPYKDMTVAELGALADAIESVLEVGKRARLLEVDGQAVDRELAISELRDVLDQRPQSENKALSAKLSKADKVKVAALSIVSSLRRMEAWARDMDDGEAGVFTRYLVKPVMDAVGIYREDKAERLRALLAIIEPRKADLLGKAINAPELGYTFENKGEFLHALLHTGNESNLEKLLLGRGWSSGLTGQVQRMTPGGKPSVDRQGNPLMTRGRVDTSKWDALVARLISEGTLTKEDYETAQAIWNLMDTIKRPAQSAHRKVYGYYFQEVEPSPLVTPFGTFRGGYVPAIADGDASNDGQIRADQAALEAQQTSFMFPTTGAGFTKARVQNYTTPLSLNLMLLPAHMDKVLRFTHLNPVIRQTASLVNSRELRAAIDAVDKTILPNLVTPWLQRTAQQAVEAQPTTPAGRAASNVFRELRKRVGVHTMFLNLVNTAQQVTGFSSAAVLVKPARLKSALARFAKGGAGDMRAEASAASLFMRDRIENSVRELNGRIQEAIVKPTIAGGLDAWVQRHGYVLQQGTQNVIDVIAWHAAYDQAIGKGASDSDAVFEADSVIRRTMGDFSPENLSMFETGSAFTRLFTMFYSYFNGQANLVGGEMQTAMRTMGWSGAGRMFFIYLFGIAIPAIVGNAIVKAAGGGLDDDEEDGYLDELLEMFFGSQLSYVAGMIPGGSVPMTMLNRFNGQFYDDRISTSPVVSAVERAVSAPGSAWKAAAGDGSARKAVTDGLTALGLVTGIPMGQLAKMAGYATGVAEGSSRPDDLGDVMRGLASGRDGSEN